MYSEGNIAVDVFIYLKKKYRLILLDKYHWGNVFI